jgi:hypothetical protein
MSIKAKVFFGALVVFGFASVGFGVRNGDARPVEIGVVILVISLGLLVLQWLAVHRFRIAVRVPHDEFLRNVMPAWVRVYGAAPPGLLPPDRVVPAWLPPSPVLAVLCPDPSALTCLRVNAATAGLNVALLDRIEDIPPHVPVALLHDTSIDGYGFAAWARGRLGMRKVFDIGPRPANVVRAKQLIQLRGARPAPEAIQRLRATGLLTDKELAWLATGTWSPIAALPPKALVGRVRRATERADGADPDRRAAAAVGFLSWPKS